MVRVLLDAHTLTHRSYFMMPAHVPHEIHVLTQHPVANGY